MEASLAVWMKGQTSMLWNELVFMRPGPSNAVVKMTNGLQHERIQPSPND